MHTTTLQDMIPIFTQANVPLHVWGPGGVGKSAVIEEVAAQKGFFCVDLRLATQEVGDLIGVPYNSVEEILEATGMDDKGKPTVVGHPRTVTRWGVPYWLAEIYSAAARGQRSILFLDEMDRAPKEVVQAVYQLVIKRQLHEHRLPPETAIIAAGNPPTDEYMVETFDRAMASRWAHVFVEANRGAWLNGFGSRCQPEISGFIAVHDALCAPVKAWDVSSMTAPSPRGWEFVDRIYRAIGTKDRRLLHLCVAAIVGPAAASEFIASLDKDWVTIKDVLSGKKTAADIKEPTQLIRVANELARHTTLKDVTHHSGGKIYTKAEIEQRELRLKDFLEAILDDRKELVIAAIKAIAGRDSGLLQLIFRGDQKMNAVIQQFAALAYQLDKV